MPAILCLTESGAANQVANQDYAQIFVFSSACGAVDNGACPGVGKKR
jgi:hypothetical protein